MTSLDDRVDRQRDRGERIKKILEKFTKEAKIRRTEVFVQQRLIDLEFYWQEFKQEDDEIKAHDDLGEEHPYIVAKYYEQVKATVTIAREKFQARLSEILNEEKAAGEEDSNANTGEENAETSGANVKNTEMKTADEEASKTKEAGNENTKTKANAELQYNTSSSVDELRRRLRRHEAQRKALLRSLEKIHEAKTTTKAFYVHKQQVLRYQWALIEATQTEIIEYSEDYTYDESYEELEDKYEEAMVGLQEKIEEYANETKISQTTRTEEPSGVVHHELKLPVLKIPTFDGDYKQWKSFIDLFEQTIHKNEKLGNAQKMHYLKTNVTGDAARIIQHLQITDTNYEAARDALMSRYENSRLLVNAQIQALINQKDSQSESAAHLRRLHDTTTECVNSLRGLDIDTKSWDPIIVYIVSQKLDNETRKSYEQSLTNPKELQPLEDFLKFIENKFHALDNLTEKRYKDDHKKEEKSSNVKRGFYRSYHATTSPSCRLCRGPHWLHMCQKFIQMGAPQRTEFVQNENLCRNCFKDNHFTSRCHSYKKCQTCKQRHHTLLHLNEHSRQQSQTNLATSLQQNKILLATALVKTNWRGSEHYLRALVDQGSQSSYITEDAVQRLQLQKKPAYASIYGVGASKAGTARGKVDLAIQSIYPSEFKTHGTFLVLDKLTKFLPDESFTAQNWDHIKNLPLADPSYNRQSTVDLLIGADIFQDIIEEGVIKGNHGTPIAQNTKLGWILSGRVQENKINGGTTICCISNVQLHEQLKLFWETEEIIDERSLSDEEKRCEEIYKQTYERDETGRYIVRLPFKDNAEELGRSRDRAVARFLQMEKKFMKNKSLHEDYKKFMREYLELGHMEPVKTKCEEVQKAYYLPHQAVLKEDSSTTKLRVVFDASSKTTSGVSLNDTMLTGPVIQQDLFNIMLRWRKYKYVYRADIEKMYRQIMVSTKDRDFQRILWRENPRSKIEEYRLTTVTYGTTSAPYLAIRTLQQLASDEEHNYNIAAEIARRDFYVDDLLSGGDTLEEVKYAQQQISQLMHSGGFNLRKWSSNSKLVLENIRIEDQEQGRLQINSYDPIKTLGIYWRPETDAFEFRTNAFSNTETLSKRVIVSETARLFDPLGWLTPIIITAKLVQQELWKLGVGWDEKLPEEMSKTWAEFRIQLPAIEDLKIPRWNEFEQKHRIELHGFCDASEKAYAAAVYTRVITKSGKVLTTLLCAKSKVAPLKKISLPKLELCGALLLAKLTKKTKTALGIEELETHAWTDSTITLAWITGDPNKWKNFVANRVTEITKILQKEKWHHVKGKENPADCASRGLWPSQIKNQSIWWNGPTWLSDKLINFTDVKPYKTELEERRVRILAHVSQKNQDDLIEKILCKYSTFTRVARVLAYCIRFIKIKGKKICESGPLSPKEIQKAKLIIIRHVQHEEFKDEIGKLIKGKEINKQSKVWTLNPFIDKDKMMRVGGRLTAAEIQFSTKFPLIIPHSGPLTTLLIDEAHNQTLHGGYTLTHTYLREQYWIVNGLSAVKQRLYRCTRCFRHKTHSKTQQMGNLPKPRVNITRPFLHTGVDYAGPIDIRMSKGRGNKSYKGYIAVFICLATKAIHVELVSDLTAQAFIAAYKRLCARRGYVGHLYSDNGTNFIAANKILQFNAKQMQSFNEEVTNALSSHNTEWHFIPPGSPHFGGLWEAGVKSVKHHLKRTIGEHKLTFEEMSTLLAQIEACLNSRPLCPLSNDPEETDVLTPGHFLVGTALLAPPEPQRLDENYGLLNRWQLLERLQQQFWKKWSLSYLTTLQQRHKWTKRYENLKVGDIVIIKDEQLPPTRWKMGKITETHPGLDNLVRVVTVKANDKVYKRPTTKICPLPIIDNEEKEMEQVVIQEEERHITGHLLNEVHAPKQKLKINPLLGLLLTMTLAMSLGNIGTEASNIENEAIKITPFKNRPGIYFEKIGNVNLITSDWKLIVYYDMTNYWQEYKGFKELVLGINEVCKHLEDLGRKYGQCNSTANIINHQLQVIKSNNDLLIKQGSGTRQTSRNRRSPFDFVGTVANKLFGVLDEEYAQRYEQEIMQFKENDDYLLSLIKNQTSIAEYTKNVLQKSTNAISTQLEMFQGQLETLRNSIRATTEGSAVEQKFILLTNYATISMLNYQQTQNAILDVLIDLHHGKINPLIITPDQLQEQLSTIRKNLPPHLAVAGETTETNMLQLYRLLSARGRITSRNVIFDITLPLANTEDYEIFKVIPVPTIHQLEYIFIEPSLDYLIVNLVRESYYAITKDELTNCVHYNEKYLCQQQHPLFNRRSNVSKCEMDLMTHSTELSPFCKLRSITPSPVWIQLSSINNWIYVLDKKYTFNVICRRKVLDITLQDDGILTLQPSCILKHDTMSITSHSSISNELNTAFIPATNITEMLQNQPRNASKPIVVPQVMLSTGNDDIKIIGKWITELHNKEKLPDHTKNHAVHHNTTYVLIGGLFLIISIYIGWQHCKTKNQPQVQPQRNIQARRRYTLSDFNLYDQRTRQNVQECTM